MTISGYEMTRLDRRQFLFATAAAAFAGPAQAGVERLGGPAFGSTWSVVARADAALVRGVVARVTEETDAAMSPYRAESEISLFNRAPAGRFAVSPQFHDVAAAALRIAEASGGAFDPCVGPLVRRYGFGPIEGRTGGGGALAVQGDVLEKTEPGITLDLCGIAKGDALDRIVTELARLGIDDALVELGGETRGMGRHPDGRPWAVAVERPGAASFAVHRILAPGPLALATSGMHPNGYAEAGRRTGHLIDPRTSRPVRGDLASVTVAARTTRAADGWATALMVLGPEAGPELAERLNLATLFLVPDGSGHREMMTGAFADLIVE